MKYILLRRPNKSDKIDPRNVTDYPIAEHVKVKLTGVDVPRYTFSSFDYDDLVTMGKVPSQRLSIRLSEDGLRRVRLQNDLLVSGSEVPSYLLKLSEFPDEWPRPNDSFLQRHTPLFLSSMIFTSLAPPPGPRAITKEQHFYDGSMAHEINMHKEICPRATVDAFGFFFFAMTESPCLVGRWGVWFYFLIYFCINRLLRPNNFSIPSTYLEVTIVPQTMQRLHPTITEQDTTSWP